MRVRGKICKIMLKCHQRTGGHKNHFSSAGSKLVHVPVLSHPLALHSCYKCEKIQTGGCFTENPWATNKNFLHTCLVETACDICHLQLRHLKWCWFGVLWSVKLIKRATNISQSFWRTLLSMIVQDRSTLLLIFLQRSAELSGLFSERCSSLPKDELKNICFLC